MGTQHPNPAVARWWIKADIGEIEIESNESSTLIPAHIEDFGIRVTTKTFLKNRLRVVAAFPEQYLSVSRKVLVQFEPDCQIGRAHV